MGGMYVRQVNYHKNYAKAGSSYISARSGSVSLLIPGYVQLFFSSASNEPAISYLLSSLLSSSNSS